MGTLIGILPRRSKREKPGEKELAISNIVFCSEEPGGYMKYTEQPDATYAPSDMVWIYMNVRGASYRPNPDGSKEIWVTEHLTVKAPDGEVVVSKEVINEHKNLPNGLDPEKLYFANFVELPSKPAEGKYLVEITAKDKISGKTARASSSFGLKS